MPAPPVFHNLRNVLSRDPELARRGFAILPNCIIANPDGTGFGNGILEVRIVDPHLGDRLQFRGNDDIELNEDKVLYRGRCIAHHMELNGDAASTGTQPLVKLNFEPAVFYEPVAAVISAIEFVNSDPSEGTRKVVIRVTDADQDMAAAHIDIDLRAVAKSRRTIGYGAENETAERATGTEPFGVLYVGISGWWQREVIRSQLSLVARR